MSDEVKPITVTILDKDYVVGCKEDEREALFASVQFLNKKMIEQRDNGKVIGSERIAVMAALNIAHEYLEFRRNNESLSSDIEAGIARMQSKIAEALTRDTGYALRNSSGH
ncbi:MAG: cell division protein ZapA [Gammaproteobacteria bacterium]